MTNFSAKIGHVLILLLFLSLGLMMFFVIKQIKFIIIKDKILKYHSLFLPFGRTLDLNNYTGKITTTETGSDGSYKVVYLVDKNNKTSFKIMGVFYKNMEEISDAIPLKKIRFSPSGGQYFKLLFGGKIKVENRGDEKKNKSTVKRILTITTVIIGIGLVFYVVGMIVKILSKLL